uniref:Uncharacterized protein n=1 Tax=Anguilla anguilla TaxID=7936 RepID=A0A0E9TGH5_ANGAN
MLAVAQALWNYSLLWLLVRKS